MRGVRSLGSIVGDNKAADSIEDTAVELSDLPNYIAEFLCDDEASQSRAIYYAHAGAGNCATCFKLKREKGIIFEVAVLVKNTVVH
jgi:FAD/FMN-containing dehydrogenase